MRPAELIHVEAIPKPGSGKNDFSRTKQIAFATIPATTEAHDYGRPARREPALQLLVQ